jgi:hypothetical protein
MQAVNTGLIISGALVLLQLVFYIFEIDMFNITISILYQLATIVFITWMMARASIRFRDKYLEKRITFTQCFLMGLMAGLLATIIISLYNYVFYAFFDPDALIKQADKVREMIDSNANIPDEDKAKIMEGIQQRFEPLNSLKNSLIFMGILSLILSLIASLFVRKKEKVEEAVM